MVDIVVLHTLIFFILFQNLFLLDCVLAQERISLEAVKEVFLLLHVLYLLRGATAVEALRGAVDATEDSCRFRLVETVEFRRGALRVKVLLVALLLLVMRRLVLHRSSLLVQTVQVLLHIVLIIVIFAS
jgi:hypothetical protein